MHRWSFTALFFGAMTLMTVSGLAGKPEKIETELAKFGPGPDGITEDVSSDECVPVGVNVWTYSPQNIYLYLSESLVYGTEIEAGGHWGRARCLKKNGPEGGRLDFYFEDLNSAGVWEEYRLIVRFGIYDRTTDTVVFDLGSMQIYSTGPDAEPLTDGDATFSIDFQSCAGGSGDDGDDGDETASETGGRCKDGKDNDGDGLTDCLDPDCAAAKWCVS